MKLSVELLLGLLLAGIGQAEPITVRVANFADVPEKILASAEGMAGHVLDKAGIAVTWVRCPGRPECRPDLSATEFRLLILNLRPARPHEDTTGFAVILPPPESGDRYAGVFFPMVEDAARNLEADEDVLLGATMAHEIGHLLLGSKAHSPAGVMCPHLGREQVRLARRGELLFTPEQAGQMQVEVKRRLRAAHANTSAIEVGGAGHEGG
jgi:hypothetical protein